MRVAGGLGGHQLERGRNSWPAPGWQLQRPPGFREHVLLELFAQHCLSPSHPQLTLRTTHSPLMLFAAFQRRAQHWPWRLNER